jgi:Cu(I)/Ag(I) efflux system membrane fusion protein
MKTKTIVVSVLAAMLLAAGAVLLYQAGKRAATGSAPAPANAARTPLYWHDPMVPGQRFDKPGKSPFMDMQLVPVYAEPAEQAGGVSISSRMQQNLGVRMGAVTRARMGTTTAVVGSVAYNERDVALVQARSGGYVERLYVRAPLEVVRKGQPLLALFVPDWVAAQEEYLAARRMAGAGTDGLASAARQRMLLAGMDADQVRLVDTSGKVQPRMTLRAPASGVVAELLVREGMTVAAGTPLFRINGLASVWVNAQVPEALAAQVRVGTPVEARSAALVGKVFAGKVGALLPEVDPATRTLTARVELANPHGQLVPGMFMNLSLHQQSAGDVLLVPSEAVLKTGRRSVVIVAQGDGRFTPVDVQTGAERDELTEIRSGLAEGQKVVLSGQFLIDSEASLRGVAARMDGAATPAGPLHQAVGTIESIEGDEIMISHGPVPSLRWDAMTMGFKAPAGGLPANVKVGDRIAFGFSQGKDGTSVIVTLAPAPGQATGEAK